MIYLLIYAGYILIVEHEDSYSTLVHSPFPEIAKKRFHQVALQLQVASLALTGEANRWISNGSLKLQPGRWTARSWEYTPGGKSSKHQTITFQVLCLIFGGV